MFANIMNMDRYERTDEKQCGPIHWLLMKPADLNLQCLQQKVDFYLDDGVGTIIY